MKKKRFIIIVLVALLYVSCQTNNPDTEDTTQTLTNLFGAYLGQPPPGEMPVRFSPTILLATNISWWISPPKFSPDGREMYYTRYEVGNPDTKHFYFMEMDDNDQWTWPQLTSFSSDSGDCHMAYSMDGNKLFFYHTCRGDRFLS